MQNKNYLKIKKIFEESIEIKKKILDDKYLINLNLISEKIYEKLSLGGKIIFCGNGGSAADAQHLTAELLIRLRPNINRESIPAISLTLDSSSMTAHGNDYNFHTYYERLISSLWQKEDILIVLSTSGNSQNIIKVLKKANQKKIYTIGFLGASGGLALKYCDSSFVVPSKITGRIQECHITAGHAILESVEDLLIKNKKISKL